LGTTFDPFDGIPAIGFPYSIDPLCQLIGAIFNPFDGMTTIGFPQGSDALYQVPGTILNPLDGMDLIGLAYSSDTLYQLHGIGFLLHANFSLRHNPNEANYREKDASSIPVKTGTQILDLRALLGLMKLRIKNLHE
jgi:hypothetical protein